MMSIDFDRTVSDDVQSNFPTTDQGATRNIPEFQDPREEALNAFFHMMQDIFNAYM